MALDRISEIEVLLHRQTAEETLVSEIVDPTSIVSSLNSLSDILADGDPSLANLIMSMHIDRIDVFDTNRVVMRMCKLGASPDTIEWFGGQPSESSPLPSHTEAETTQPRRRTRICTDLMDSEIPRLGVLAEMASDPNRFAGMPENWFWVDEFSIPEKSCWSKDNAQAVLARYQQIQAETGKKPSCNALAKEFGVSRPTIHKALDEAQAEGSDAPTSHRRKPTVKVKGNQEVEARIEMLHDSGMLEKDIAADIGVSRSSITGALTRLYEKRGIEKPDGRRERHRK
uniref:Regulatory protein GntR HTH n=2 Tax=Rubinisphaera brasiliensis TaxID=119 RepID=F0SSU8_RUBBR|nr:regulatory protein GntR HTH [Rubinisphaera brasiliensis DSM 5305]